MMHVLCRWGSQSSPADTSATDIVLDSDSSVTAVAAGPAMDTARSSRDIRPVSTLDKMVVTADRRQRLMETAQSMIVIEPEQWTGTNKSMADVIAEHTGVQTRRYGGLGSFQTVSVRGVVGSELLVLLDGIPVNSAIGGAVDLGRINPALFEAVEIYKGFVPSRFGGNGLGGAINMKTSRAHNGTTADFNASFGAYGMQRHNLAISHAYNDNLRTMGLLGFAHSDNDHWYIDRNNTPYNADDDERRRLENAQYTAGDLLVHTAGDINERRTLATVARVTLSKKHIPGMEGKTNKTAFHSEKGFSIQTRLNDQAAGRRVLSLEPAIAYMYQNGLRFSSSLDSGFGASHATQNVPNTYTELGVVDQSLSIPLTLYITPGGLFEIEPTVRLDLADINPTVNTTGNMHGNWHSREAALSAATDVIIAAGAFGARIGASAKGVYSATEGGLDGASRRTVPAGDTLTSIWSAMGGLSLHLINDRMLLYTNAGRYSNQPSLRERYGARGAHNPNPHLQSETGLSAELGAKLRWPKLYAEVCGYWIHPKNKILTVFDGRQTKSINCADARVFGVETWLLWSPFEFLRFESGVTLQRTENLTRYNNWYGRRLPNEPAIDMRETLAIGPFKGLSFQYSADLKSEYYRDPGNTKAYRVPGDEDDSWEVLHDFLLEWKAPRHLTLTLSATNVTNDLLTRFETVHDMEAEYSWTLYPVNRWCAALAYTF